VWLAPMQMVPLHHRPRGVHSRSSGQREGGSTAEGQDAHVEDNCHRQEALLLARTVEEVVAASGRGGGLRLGVAMMRGPRGSMEDRVQIQPITAPPLPPLPREPAADPAIRTASAAAYLAIFDGHNGSSVAHAASTGLHLCLRRRLLANSRALFMAVEAPASQRPGLPPLPFSATGLSEALAGAFHDFDSWLHGHARPASWRQAAGSIANLPEESDVAAARAVGPRAAVAADHMQLESEEPPAGPSEVAGPGATVSTKGAVEIAIPKATAQCVYVPSTSSNDGEGGDGDGTSLADERRERTAALHRLQHEEQLAEALAVRAPQMHESPHSSYGGGTTALVCVACDGRLHLASVGDSRAVLARPDAPPLRLTRDHTPSVPSEHERIIGLGGFVLRGRVHGILAVSRALGDLELQPYVSPCPDVSVITLEAPGASSTSTDAVDTDALASAVAPSVLLLASDGVWGCLSDEEAAAIATAHDEPQAAADALLNEVRRRGGRDNASVIVATWPGAHSLDATA